MARSGTNETRAHNFLPSSLFPKTALGIEISEVYRISEKSLFGIPKTSNEAFLRDSSA